MRDSASATPSLHPAYLINKLNNYVKELNIILPNGTNKGALPPTPKGTLPPTPKGA